MTMGDVLQSDRAPLPVAGWYEDPQQAGEVRYWDGSRWTEDHAPAAPGPAVGSPGASAPAPGPAATPGAFDMVLGVSAILAGIGLAVLLVLGTIAAGGAGAFWTVAFLLIFAFPMIGWGLRKVSGTSEATPAPDSAPTAQVGGTPQVGVTPQVGAPATQPTAPALAPRPPDLSDLDSVLAHFGARYAGDKAVHVAPDLPAKALDHALRSYGAGVGVEPGEVLALVDNTLMHGAKTGALLTRTDLCVHDVLETPVRLPLAEVRDVYVVKNDLVVNGKAVLNIVTVDDRDGVAELVRALARLGGTDQ